ncbi:cupin domain-containing protein [Methylocystis rosea]|uniref:cupin domain-containing protein n=1 Tax=Methylocystis rosea TaxID=173366 RepID=UPI00035DF9B4|nr:cupin domain-containing protein [Methylocystis rosea]
MPVITPQHFVTEDREQSDVCGPARAHWISEAAGLTQFGALIEILQPGSLSSLKHWHSAEDELIYVLEGEITLIEGETETILRAGDAAAFNAGVAVGHQLHNRSKRPTRCLVVGARAPVDAITYPYHDRVCHRDRSLPDDIWTDGSGAPASNPYR